MWLNDYISNSKHFYITLREVSQEMKTTVDKMRLSHDKQDQSGNLFYRGDTLSSVVYIKEVQRGFVNV